MMPLAARRTWRMAWVLALSLAAGYGLAMPLPYLAPVFAFMLTARPAPPPAFKGLVALLVVVFASLGVGLLMVPLLLNYPVPAVLLMAVGLYFSSMVSLALGQGPVGLLLTVGFTMIPAAGMVEFGLALAVIQALLIGIAIAVVCQWLVYPWFPEDPGAVPPPAPAGPADARWISVRAALIVLPPVMLAFSNPALYLPTIIKSLLLAQQGSTLAARAAGRELLGSTVLAGLLAICFWFALKLNPDLWMFFLWTLLIGGFCAAQFYGALASRFGPSFWQNVMVTLLILLGPAVEDSASGKDVYQAFAVRLALFIGVTGYAWLAIVVLERWRARSRRAPLKPQGAAG